MAKVKETKVALKGEDPKKAPKASKTARKVPKHHEEVKVQSDSSSSNSDSSSGSESDDDAEKRKSTKKPKLSRAKETEPNSPPVADDSSEDNSSDDDSSEGEVMKDIREAKAKKAAAPATVTSNGAVKKTKDSKTKDTKIKESKSKSKEMVSDSSDSDSDDEASADAGAAKATTEEEDSDEEMEDAPAAAPAREPVDPTKAIAPQPFNPPAGYKPLDTKQASANTLSSLLSNPGEKQVWHITAPSSVPLSQIQSISLAAIQNQTPILSHKDTNYTLAEEKASKTTKKLLVPGDKGYASSEVPVSRSLVLQQVISLPNLPKHKASTAAPQSVLQRGKREPRPQPEGLRMRFKPIGYGAGEPGAVLGADESGDEDEVGSAPSFRLPTTTESEKEKKRKRDAEEAAATPRTEKKRRKEKKNSKDDDDVEIMEGMEDEVHRAEKALVEGTKKEVPQTEEEKARKKAEKKERKSKEKKAKK